MLNKRRNSYFVISIVLICSILTTGCATIPYNYGLNIEQYNTLRLASGEPQIERGGRQPLLDALGHYIISLPSKILLLNWRANNHNISKETEERLKQYLADNDLHNVKVRLNQYAPVAEWSRLFRNNSVNPFFRYTFGVISLVFYTLLPERLFAGLIGGDHYNPYTNTINLYSGHDAIALHEAGHAKDFAKCTEKGLYATARLLPLVSLFQEGVATGDAIGYYKEKGLTKDEKEAYKILYPAYCTYIGGEVSRWIDLGYFEYAAVVPGHIFGWIKSAFVKEESTKEESTPQNKTFDELNDSDTFGESRNPEDKFFEDSENNIRNNEVEP